MRAITALVNAIVRANAPDLRTEKRRSPPRYVGSDLGLVVRAFAHRVGVEFWKASTVPDPQRLLEGTGKDLRQVKVRTATEARVPELADLIRSAMELDRIPRRARYPISPRRRVFDRIGFADAADRAGGSILTSERRRPRSYRWRGPSDFPQELRGLPREGFSVRRGHGGVGRSSRGEVGREARPTG